MSGLQHTPGPWVVGRNGDGNLAIFTDHTRVRSLVAGFKSGTVSEADARLIAAASELLDLAIACELWLSTLPEGKKMQEVCRSAITRATGKDFTRE